MNNPNAFTRKMIGDKLHHIQQAIWALNAINTGEPITALLDTEAHEAAKAYLLKLAESLIALRKKHPIGKRYTGTVYLRKAYTSLLNPEYDKITGTLLMSESSTRWRIEHVKEGVHRDGHYSCVFQSIHPEVLIDESKAVDAFEKDTAVSTNADDIS